MRSGRRGRGRGGAPLSKRALLQHVNRELWTLAADDVPLPLYCECGRDDCILSVEVARDEYAAAMRHPGGALVVPEHRGEWEPVLQRFDAVLLVDTGSAP